MINESSAYYGRAESDRFEGGRSLVLEGPGVVEDTAETRAAEDNDRAARVVPHAAHIVTLRWMRAHTVDLVPRIVIAELEELPWESHLLVMPFGIMLNGI